jgi:hypothetical protein
MPGQIGDLRYTFFGGGSTAEYDFLNAASNAGLTAVSLLQSAFDNDMAASGEFTRRRGWGFSNSGGLSTDVFHGVYFTAKRTEAITQIRCWTGATAAAATPTDIRLGVYSENAATGDLTQVAVTANDTTLLAAATTAYTKAFVSGFTKTAGVRYFVGLRVTSAAAMPTMTQGGATSSAGIEDTILATLPRQVAQFAAVAGALPTPVTAASLATSRRAPFFQLLP